MTSNKSDYISNILLMNEHANMAITPRGFPINFAFTGKILISLTCLSKQIKLEPPGKYHQYNEQEKMYLKYVLKCHESLSNFTMATHEISLATSAVVVSCRAVVCDETTLFLTKVGVKFARHFFA